MPRIELSGDMSQAIITRTKFLSEREKKVCDLLIRLKNYKAVAQEMHTTEGSIRNVTYRIRNRVDRARDFVQFCESLQSKLPRKKRYIVN